MVHDILQPWGTFEGLSQNKTALGCRNFNAYLTDTLLKLVGLENIKSYLHGSSDQFSFFFCCCFCMVCSGVCATVTLICRVAHPLHTELRCPTGHFRLFLSGKLPIFIEIAPNFQHMSVICFPVVFPCGP